MKLCCLARAAGLKAPRLSQFERGTRQPDRDELEALARVLQLEPCRLTRGTDYGFLLSRGRFRKNNATVSRWFPPAVVREAAPDHRAWSRHRRAEEAFPELMSRLERRLGKRRDHQEVRAFLGYLNYDSKLEALFAVRLVACGALPIVMSPRARGFHCHALFDGEPWRALGHNALPGLALEVQGARAVFFPQVQMKGFRHAWRLDALVAVISTRQVEWVDLEIDGAGHHDSGDAARSSDLGLRRVALSQADLLEPDFSRRLWERLVPAAGSPAA